jgi:hypothetical protein
VIAEVIERSLNISVENCLHRNLRGNKQAIKYFNQKVVHNIFEEVNDNRFDISVKKLFILWLKRE